MCGGRQYVYVGVKRLSEWVWSTFLQVVCRPQLVSLCRVNVNESEGIFSTWYEAYVYQVTHAVPATRLMLKGQHPSH